MKNTVPASASEGQAAYGVPPAVELLPPSLTVRLGKRRLTLSWRARKPLPTLLGRLLQRSWRQVLAPVLRVSVAAAAVCGAWQTSALAAMPAPGTLPAGWSVVNGNVVFTQNGNVLNINQLSPQAIANFLSFSIGSDAAVNISQPSSAAAFLAKVTGGDISQIYGKLTAPGLVALYNPNGILIGPGGTVDVGRFIASTLNINDSDFLAGKLTFSKQGTVGSVENQGTIKSATGGSVYLIGSSVTNGGIIQSPQGEVILAAGETVTLADTATPGVTVNVTGNTGNVTNLGAITAEAGRIGIAAGLISNSGTISASSVVREGGRIFLRASQNLTTTASSSISADGTAGGNIKLYADNQAYIDGNVSATGSAGPGGYVETSGLKQLDVVKAPRVGAGGTWYIDPYDLEVVADSSGSSNVSSGSDGGSNVITSVGSSSQIRASSISGQLNDGISVILTTGAGGSSTGGNITVNSAINKTSGSSAGLTLNANNSIAINADITSTSGALNLNLNSNYSGIAGDHTVNVSGATIKLNGGVLSVLDVGSNTGSGNIAINNGATINLDQGGTLNARTLTIAAGGTLSSIYNAGVILAGDLNNSGTVGLNNSALSVGGKLVNQGTVNLANVSGTLGNVTNSGSMTMASMFQGIAATAFNNSGSLTLSNGSTLNAGAVTNTGTATINVSTLNASTLNNSGTATVSDGAVTVTDKITNAGQFSISNSTISTVNGFINSLGATLNLGSQSTFNSGTVANAGTMNVGGMAITIAALENDATGTVTVSNGASLNGTSFSNSGTLNMQGNAGVRFSSGVQNQFDGTISGTGTIGTLNNNGTLAPGGDGSVGALNIDGDLTLGSGSKLLLDFSNGGYDQINFLSCGTISLGGTLQTRLLNGYTAPVGTSYQVFDTSIGAQFAPGSYFRNVTGDVLTIGGNKQMIKATTTNGLTLAMAGSATLTASGGDSDWGSLASWSGAGYIPTQIDTVVIGSGMSAHHGSGTDTIDKLVLNGGKLDMYGGSSLTVATSTSGSGDITVSSPTNTDGPNLLLVVGPTSGTTLTLNNAVTNANVSVAGGNLVLGGNARFYGMTVNSGNVTGNPGSRLVVSDSFYQGGGNMTLADAALSSASGTLTVGNITANNLVLEAQNGDIGQYGSSCMSISTSLHVTKQLIASATGNINLAGANSNNQIAAFAANSSGQGNITLLNHLNTDDTSVVTINGVNAANGSINIENYGAMRTEAIGSNADFLGSLPTAVDGTSTSTANKLAMLGINATGLIKARGSSGSVNMSTHSPLTIGSGGVDASSNIALTAGSSANSSDDNLIINGLLSSQGGNVALSAGNSLTLNANVATSAPGLATLSALAFNYTPGVSITDANGVRIPVPLPSSPSSDPIPAGAQGVAPGLQQQSISSIIAILTQSTTQTSSSTGKVSMTDGGGTADKESTKDAAGAPKAAKLYCN
ncbi:beta strand repeat-containing protein [Herbaspirillum chlorophenolicum]|uniref:beta strand repeat-containing protein n=1 Tax=Herbaspirillum chlorophenolicum TaxID=211589 RepID=UPI00067AFF42|nr:filamentous hemagglutinin N-terminal domain-containing protein [Herbaspirillum chlorophenolicum]